jgi:hypothetical protein
MGRFFGAYRTTQDNRCISGAMTEGGGPGYAWICRGGPGVEPGFLGFVGDGNADGAGGNRGRRISRLGILKGGGITDGEGDIYRRTQRRRGMGFAVWTVDGGLTTDGKGWERMGRDEGGEDLNGGWTAHPPTGRRWSLPPPRRMGRGIYRRTQRGFSRGFFRQDEEGFTAWEGMRGERNCGWMRMKRGRKHGGECLVRRRPFRKAHYIIFCNHFFQI